MSGIQPVMNSMSLQGIYIYIHLHFNVNNVNIFAIRLGSDLYLRAECVVKVDVTSSSPAPPNHVHLLQVCKVMSEGCQVSPDDWATLDIHISPAPSPRTQNPFSVP